MPGCRKIVCLYAALLAARAAAQTAAMRDAFTEMQRGEFVSAERKLRGEVAARPSDAKALSLLAAALDNQHRIEEAAPFHARAAALAPRSVEVLVSYAAHFSMAGNDDAA